MDYQYTMYSDKTDFGLAIGSGFLFALSKKIDLELFLSYDHILLGDIRPLWMGLGLGYKFTL